MRLATILEQGRNTVAVVRDDHALPIALPERGFESIRTIAAGGRAALDSIASWAEGQPDSAHRPLESLTLGPSVPNPGAIYTIGHNYRNPAEPDDSGPGRPLVYGKAANSVAGHRSTLSWDRTLTDSVDGECELAIVIGSDAVAVPPSEAMAHVFGYTCINDISSRDAWLDGDQWLLGKSMPGFCPVGPWIVTADELDPTDLRLGCAINGEAIQDGRTSQMRFAVRDVIAYLSRHVKLQAGDLIATGTPARLESPPGPERRLRPGDEVTVWIENIGELTTIIA
jgi:2-keto-4-pentenoate hydratase/2-oxohepta-3-ene-1,7-dioic acid hydratase in catechol pathway